MESSIDRSPMPALLESEVCFPVACVSDYYEFVEAFAQRKDVEALRI